MIMNVDLPLETMTKEEVVEEEAAEQLKREDIAEEQSQQNESNTKADDAWDAASVDALFPKAAALSIVIWLLLVVLVLTQTPPEYHEVLREEERVATFLAAVVMFVTLLALLMPSLLFKTSYPSGIVIAGTAVCFVAMCTNLILCLRPTVVVVDPVTKARVFLLRWCEWIPLGGLMTFLSEAVYVSDDTGGMEGALFSTLCQTLSIVNGMILPLCKDVVVWRCVFAFSFLSYTDIFRRVYIKRKAYLKSIQKSDGVQDQKLQDQVKFAYFLLLACSIVWSVLVVLYCINVWIHTLSDLETKWYYRESLAMIVDTSFDVLAKSIYMKLITDIHQALFDETYQWRKQLTEMRQLISVMWDSSSDVILISIRTNQGLSAILSPAFFPLVGAKLPESLHREGSEVALMCSVSSSGKIKCDYVETNDILVDPHRNHKILQSAENRESVLKGAQELLEMTWNNTVAKGVSTPLLEHPLHGEDGTIRQSEIKISYYSESARVGVIRDVSERYLRLEAERKAHMEMVARQKDAQAVNRFTRHEVKNGLLEGIELCDSLRSAVEDLVAQSSLAPSPSNPSQRKRNGSVGEESDREVGSRAVSALTRRFIEDLDYNLHSVLDCVLAEAMARDVIHGDYKPRHERIDVKGVLSHPGLGIGFTDKFPIEVLGGSLPYVSLDAQLLRHIHRNALSNACKYGKAGGKVVTQLSFDSLSKTFTINVINEPGEMHSKLVSMGESAKAAVFQQGARLHSHLNLETGHISSGDGAWIMQKCAKTLDGECQIEFLEDKTVFTFSCPAQPLVVTDWSKTQDFEVPSNTWGIAIDDSKIQRRLLSRIFLFAGVQESKTVVLGESYSEVAEFKEKVLSVVKEYPDDRILILVDENLDFGKSNEKPHVMSGSLLMQDILKLMSPTEEQHVLALVRSANDSAEETELYCARTHGFFPKGPLQRDRVREILAPLWADRFMRTDLLTASSS
ncbi:hypothetical protein FisN_19Hh075 [Fistulifera solaris]|uniref:Uncharacterized protein n=1 Tax=Fistulifera solaris TaxID=1519565 RepID=A0A1Z5JZP0_FISSO|nr:hypothetical protein FisN_19Hh075 [Fistulifera solaris]|eukprot:GAX19500.1 hypothetical protein FisN_19Hh075 [Fistulifera solaris]